MRRTFQIQAFLHIEDAGDKLVSAEDVADFAKDFIYLDYQRMDPVMGDTSLGEKALIIDMGISWPTIREVSNKMKKDTL